VGEGVTQELGEGVTPGAQSHKGKVSIQKQISNINNEGDNVCLILTTSNFRMKFLFKSLKCSPLKEKVIIQNSCEAKFCFIYCNLPL